MVYHPVDPEEQERFHDVMTPLIQEVPRQYEIISGQDLNASVGIRESKNDDFRTTIGLYGLKRRMKKGSEMLEVLASNNLRVCNTFFKKKSYHT